MSALQTNMLFNRDAEDTLQRSGAILRGSGPPAPFIGFMGNVYIDTTNWNLYLKRDSRGRDPWGFPLFAVPVAYQAGLNYYGPELPDNAVGQTNDYFLLWGATTASGIGAPKVSGPKAAGVWPAAVAMAGVTPGTTAFAEAGHAI